MAVVRELTKKFEEVRRGSVRELSDYYAVNGEPKGELVLVIEGASEQVSDWTDEQVDALIRETLVTKTPRDTAESVSQITGISKKEIYKRVIANHV